MVNTQVQKVILAHDGAGLAADWFVDYVKIDVISGGRTYQFSVNQWLDGEKREIQLSNPDVSKHKKPKRR